jgi:hypothetical protein
MVTENGFLLKSVSSLSRLIPKKTSSCFVLVLALVLCVNPMSGQQHALTVDQCRADVQLWAPINVMDALKDGSQPPPPALQTLMGPGMGSPSLDEINLRLQEVAQCQKLDPGRPFEQFDHSKYPNAVLLYTLVVSVRMNHFLERNHLLEQFVADDKEGKR